MNSYIQNAAYKELFETIGQAIDQLVKLIQSDLSWNDCLIAVAALADDTRVSALCDVLDSMGKEHRTATIQVLDGFLERLALLEKDDPIEPLSPETIQKLTGSSKELCHHIDQDEDEKDPGFGEDECNCSSCRKDRLIGAYQEELQ